MNKIKQIELYDSNLTGITDTDTKFVVNGWVSLVSELVDEDHEGRKFQGTILYFPGVTFQQLKVKE